MKKKFMTSLLALTGFLLFSITAFAGDINSAEQRIIAVISATYTYDGAYYRVTDEYIAKVSAYLSRDDVDMTEGEVSSYIRQFYANIPTGIASGYMVKVGDVEEEEEKKSDPPKSEEPDPSPADTNHKSSSGSGHSDEEPSGSAEAEELQDNTAGSTEAGELQDNTIGSTEDGEVEYTVYPIDEEVMYIWDIDFLDVHREAYKDSEIIGTLAKGDKVIVIGAATSGWAQINYNGEIGYVSASYLRTQSYIDGAESETDTDNSEEVEESDADHDAETDGMEADKEKTALGRLPRSVNLMTISFVIVAAIAVAAGVVLYRHRNRFRK